MAAPPPAKAPRFLVLDAMRGLGALFVVFGHYHFELWPDRPGFIVESHAYLVVDLFFLLSGFVLAHAFYDKPTFDMWDYTKKRIFRLWPLHAAALLAALLLMYFSGDAINGFGLLLNILLLHNIGIGDWEMVGINYPSWSLSVELVANIVVGFIILAIPSRRWNSLILALISIASAVILFFTVDNMNQQVNNVFGVVNTGLLRGFITFPAGILAYRFYMAHKARFERTSWLRTLIVAVLLGFFMASVALPSPGKADFLFLPLYALVIIGVSSPGPFWNSFSKYFRVLGEISFAMYVSHMVILKFMKETGFWPHDYLLGLLFAWTASCLVAALAHYGFEKPVYSWATKRWCKPAPAKSSEKAALSASTF
jgi:peptidoglycan/LPS O-acetylase OafA/YrhL